MDDKQEALDIPLTKQEPNEHEMAALVASAPIAPHALGKRAGGAYRPTPAKTFQCRGFGDCRMVFSRSEHLARHIRKHTGERPFACHCSKQFSRLDNLRQHAQTVHADKAEENEAMMRDLTSLHATMVASHKSGRRRAAPSTKARPGTATGTEGVASQPSLHSPTSPTFEDSSRNNRHSFAAPSPTSTLGPHSPQSPPGVRRTSPFSAQSPPQRPSTTSPFAPPPTSNPPPVPSPFQNPFAQERTTTPFTPYNNPFESPQQPPFVPPPVPGSSHEWDQPFVLGQPPLPSAKQRAQRPSIDTSTIHHPNKRTTPPPQSLDSRSPIQAPGPRRPLDSHLFPQSSHAQHLPVAHPPHPARETTQWMSPTAGPVLPQGDSQRWQEQQNSDYYHYPRAVQAQQELQQQPPPPPPSTTMVEEAFRLGVGLGLAIDPGSGEWPPEQVMEVDMVPGQDMEGGMYAWDDRPPPLSASSSMGTTQEETTSTWTPPSASMSKEILASDLTTIQTPPPSASTLTTQTNVQGVEGALPALYQHPLPPQTQMQGPPPHPDLTSPISPLAPPVPEKDRYRLELARQQLQQLYAQRGMRDEMAPLHSASQPAWSSVDGNQFHPLPPHAMYHPQQPPPAQQAPSSHHPMYGWMQNGY